MNTVVPQTNPKHDCHFLLLSAIYFFLMVFVLHQCKLIIHFLFIMLLLLYADELEKKLDFHRIDNLPF